MSTIGTYVVTFNCGRQPISPPVFAPHLFAGLHGPREPPSILVLCLQELAPIAPSFLGGSCLLTYLTPFHHAVTLAAASLSGEPYVNIITRNVGMTAIMVFVLREKTAQVRWLETAEVGVGVQQMGNKGAVGVRMGWSTGNATLEMTLVSAHLAPMEDALDRRNEDWKNIVRGLVFKPVSPLAVRKVTAQRLPEEGSNSSETEPLLHSDLDHDSIPPLSGLYTPTSHLIFAGDLNYRTSLTKPSPSSYHTFPQPTKDVSSPLHYHHLLASDQLTRELRGGRTCHGLQESPIDFLPTYKYSNRARSIASGKLDTGHSACQEWLWAKHRWASWCDRVLYLDIPPWMREKESQAKVKVRNYTALPLMESSDHRPVAFFVQLPAVPISEPTEDEKERAKTDVRLMPPFVIDPLWREKRTAARRKEIVVGLASFTALTWEGRGLLLAVLCGALGGWAIVKSLLEG